MSYRRHFRHYFKSGHPAYIVGEDKNSYDFHRVTSSSRNGHHSNWKVDPNPDRSRGKPMYIIHQEETDGKVYFGRKPLPYNADLKFIKKKNKKR